MLIIIVDLTASVIAVIQHIHTDTIFWASKSIEAPSEVLKCINSMQLGSTKDQSFHCALK